MTDKSHLWYLVKPPLLFLHPDDTSKRLCTPSIRITQPPRHELFSHHFSGPQTSIDFSAANFFYLDQTVTAFCIVNTKLCLMDRDPHRSRSLSLKSPRSSFRRALSLTQNTAFHLSSPTRLRKGQVYWTRCHHRHLLRPRFHRLPPPPRLRPQVRFPLSLSSIHLLNGPENIFYHYNDPNSDIGYVCFGMWVLHPSYPLFAHLFT